MTISKSPHFYIKNKYKTYKLSADLLLAEGFFIVRVFIFYVFERIFLKNHECLFKEKNTRFIA